MVLRGTVILWAHCLPGSRVGRASPARTRDGRPRGIGKSGRSPGSHNFHALPRQRRRVLCPVCSRRSVGGFSEFFASLWRAFRLPKS